jgi:hypothetical protein
MVLLKSWNQLKQWKILSCIGFKFVVKRKYSVTLCEEGKLCLDHVSRAHPHKVALLVAWIDRVATFREPLQGRCLLSLPWDGLEGIFLQFTAWVSYGLGRLLGCSRPLLCVVPRLRLLQASCWMKMQRLKLNRWCCAVLSGLQMCVIIQST